MGKLPFVASIFWKVLFVVAFLVVATFYLFIRFTDYERTVTDTVGATLSGLILTYLLHLWMLPAEALGLDEYSDEEFDDEYDDEDSEVEDRATDNS